MPPSHLPGRVRRPTLAGGSGAGRLRAVDQRAVKRHVVEPPRFEVTASTPAEIPAAV